MEKSYYGFQYLYSCVVEILLAILGKIYCYRELFYLILLTTFTMYIANSHDSWLPGILSIVMYGLSYWAVSSKLYTARL